jgi:hypothetical protein
LPLRQNKTGVNLLTTGGNLTTQKVRSSVHTVAQRQQQQQQQQWRQQPFVVT